MADVNANIGVHIDTSAALAELKNLQRQLATFHSSVAKNSAASAAAQKNLQTNLLNSINATGKFSAQMGLVRTSTESFTHALEKNKLSMREYFRYAGGSTKSFGKLFRQEFDTIGKVAEERVKKMQTQYIKMGRDSSGAMKAMAITPRTLDMNDYATKTALAAQKQALFNQLVKQGSTNLLNFGKNTQWAGRQLMVGFTVPLAYFGTAAAKTFMDLEAQAVKFKRVYGDMFTTTDETNKALADIEALAEQFTKYGVSAVKTMELASQAAAMGKQGADLTAQVAEANRLAVLGGVEQTQALETTISITNAFGIAAEDLAKKVDFLNSVENQTVVSIEDLTIAIPKAGPVVKQLGGDVEDLAFFLTAMKEGGINASEGANALKSGLAALINPTAKASAMLAGYGINIKAIVEGNQGNVRQTVIDFSRALDTLDPLNRARAIEQLFGKFQFSRLSTLFQNVTKDGTQASRVLQLAGSSVEQLAILSERELKTVEDAVGTQFKSAVEELKLAIAPIGKTFLEAVTPIVRVIGDILDKFNNLGDGTKKFIVIASTLVGIIGPTLLMTFGLLANGVANIIKLFLALRGGFLRLGGNTKILAEQTNYMNAEQLEAATVATSLNQAHTRLTQSFTAETSAVRLLRQAYIDATVAAANFARANPGMMMPGKGGAPKKFARGTASVPGRGRKDNVPAVLMPGEAVIPTDIAQDPQYQPIIEAMMNGTLQAFGTGTGDAQPFANSPQFQPKIDLGGPSAQVLNSNPSQVNRLVAGMSGFAMTDSEFQMKNAIARKAKLLPEGQFRFNGVVYTATSPATASRMVKEINSQLKESAQGGVGPQSAVKTISNRMDTLVSEGKPLTPSKVFKHISAGKSTSGGATANNPAIAKLRKEINAQTAGSGLDRETAKLKNALTAAGLTPKEQQDFLRKQESHILKPQGISGSVDPRKWQSGQLVSDYAGLNNYLNRAGGSAVGSMINDIIKDPNKLQTLGYSPKQIRQLSYDQAFAATGKHPTTAKEFQSIARIAKFEVDMHEKGLAKVDKIYQAKGVVALTGVRQPSFYNKLHKRVIQLGVDTASRVSRGKVEGFSREQQRQIASGVVTGQTGSAKPARVTTTSGAPSEKRTVGIGKNEAILNKESTKALKSGRSAFIPGLGKLRIAGAEQGIPTGQKTGSTTVGAVSQSAQLSRAQLIAATEKISLKEAKRRIAAERKLTTSMEESTKAQMTSKEKLKEFSSKAGVGIGAMSGLTIAASFAGGQVGEMAQKIMPFVFGLQGITMLLPMLANPWVAAIAAIAVVGGVFIKMSKDMENARKEGIVLAQSMGMTSEKLNALSIIAGTVSASEEANRRRKNLVSGTTDAQRQFGQNTLESDFGKQIIADIETQSKNGNSIKEISQNLANSLAVAVAQGAVTTSQARSIAAALGEKLGSYEIPALVSGKLVSLLGPNGENLTTDPLQVTLQIQQDSMNKQVNAFKTALEGVNLLENTFAGAKLDMAPKSIFDRFKNLFDPTTLFDYSKERNQSAKLSSAAVQLTVQEVAQNQGLVDSLNRQYDVKVKMAKTDAEIKKIEDERKAGLVELNSSNSNALDLLIKQRSQLGEDAFAKGIKAAADTMYKEGPMAVFKDQALEQLNKLKNSKFKAQLEIGLASGQISPTVITKILSTAAGSKGFETSFKLLVDKQGLADAALIADLLPSAGANDKARSLMLDYVNNNQEEFDKDLQAISFLNQINPTYGITLDLKTNGVQQIATATNALKQIENLPDRLTKDVVAKLAEQKPGEWKAFYDQWTILSEGKDFVNKNLKVSFDIVSNDPNFKGFGTSAGKSAADIIAKGGILPGAIPGGGVKPPVEPKARDTTLDDILNRLKMVRKASINATGGIGELLKQTGGKGLTNFGGVMQKLMAQKPGAMNKEFLDFISQMDDKTRKTYMTIKDGQPVLTKQGNALKEAFDEAVIGEYQLTQSQTIDSTKAQWSAFMKLKAAGVATAQAVEMVADAELAVAINGKDIDSKELRRMATDAKTASEALKNLQQDLNMETREGQFKIFKESYGEAVDYFDAQEALIRQEREASSEFKGYTSTIETQTQKIKDATDTINEYQDEIDGLQRKLETDESFGTRVIDQLNSKIEAAQRDLEVNAVYGSRVIDGLNAQVDALNRTADIQFDRPLANLSDESDILSNTLGLIDRQEEKINKKYELQEQALSKIAELNSEIAAQQKQRLTLADALSQGDVAAAAAAAQDMRATAAEAASRRSSGTLAAAREAEIGAVSVSGMSKVQIEERQFKIGQETFVLQQQRQIVEANIQKIQDQIFAKEQLRLPITAQIKSLEDQIYAKEQLRLPIVTEIQGLQDKIYKTQFDSLDPAQKALDKATRAKEQYEKQTEALFKTLEYQGLSKEQWTIINTELIATESKIKALEASTSKSAKNTKAILDSWQALKDKSITITENINRIITTTNIVNTVYTSSGSSGSTGNSSSGRVGRMYGGKIMPMNYGGMVPSYFAAGGRVGSDSVPAMLTPGEFVMNKAATKRFGPMLNQMNNSKFPSMIEDMTPAVYSSNNSSIVSPTITSVATTVADNSSTMYNYNIGISVPQSNASSNDIARSVISQIKYIDSQRIRGQK